MAIFTEEMRMYFGATIGAYSPVTEREATGDKSVTIDTEEKSILEQRFPLTSFHRKGGAPEDGKQRSWPVTVHLPSRRTIDGEVTITYPKKDKNELRLYFNRPSGFYPIFGDIWFIYIVDSDSKLHIGLMPDELWKQAFQAGALPPGSEGTLNIDDEDDQYQQLVGAIAAKQPGRVDTWRYPRDPKVAMEAIKTAKYTCEVNDAHETFVSAVTNMPFMEAHHIVPVSTQGKFENSLDVIANISSLCPICHRAVHYGTCLKRFEIITTLFEARKELLEDSGINIELNELLRLYRVTSNR